MYVQLILINKLYSYTIFFYDLLTRCCLSSQVPRAVPVVVPADGGGQGPEQGLQGPRPSPQEPRQPPGGSGNIWGLLKNKLITATAKKENKR